MLLECVSIQLSATLVDTQALACHLIEERLLKDLLHLPCRHHILEIVVEKAFTAMKIEASSGPDIAIFKRFRDFWQDIDQTNFDTASDEVAITSFKERVISELLVGFAFFDERVGLEERGERWCGTWTQFLELRHPQHKRYVIVTKRDP
ncbi:hypothetical protein Bpfe_009821 [Biomphalaria pfeifferi]|uniref:Uncharacterized protein n=1 Tax=Biomphalaria pfeifferi TaxID=112525 RepID=A0AAD8FEA5_BIOPF|nr:hypothetical protein Bpfe_009821 [Biomphalaria pfeifferi]